ncbi:23S rRNA (guanosine(2251)-2'-O)-methyltransferase RlmB [Mesonia maritima]|uniref:23S rRNA (Guanosine2251-2'-O)-methyltransferase n=1 Tax=Mesonia maritima TaxID=1793873 RepID=A0ABU1K6X1_9FLAO|nr:23S rRNA (guanosine(2251)-2'-O)-methyltransferase RlmB [Mesonia maritima]MDR6301358.1 23S rRNA (guanosine2251-2'-O)-methyltransferase [Mesonia maritima]
MKNIIYGIHSTAEALKQEESIDKLFVQKNLSSQNAKEVVRLAKEKKVQVSYVPIEKLNKLTQENHQGIVAKISPIQLYSIENLVESAFKKTSSPLFLLLDQVSDVRNLGAIIRTAECTGVNGIILSKQGSAALNDQTVKTSTGAIFNVPICKVDHLKDAIFFLSSYDVKTIAATEKSNDLIYDVDLKGAIALIMGSEGKGITPSILKMVNHRAKLPLLGDIESLNVSVACGAILFEAVRQRL